MQFAQIRKKTLNDAEPRQSINTYLYRSPLSVNHIWAAWKTSAVEYFKNQRQAQQVILHRKQFPCRSETHILQKIVETTTHTREQRR